MEKLTIISVGLGDLNLLTGKAIEIISNHKNIYISEERFSSLKSINTRIKIISYSKLEETIKKSEKDIAIIVSGDYGFYSLAKTFIRIFSDTKDIELVNGISSLQYFASKLETVYHDWTYLSLHGSNINKLPAYVSYNEKVFLLTGGKYSVSYICNTLKDAGFSDLNIFVGENLSYENERICFGSLEEFRTIDFDDLTVMLIENPYFVENTSSSYDEDFIFSKQQGSRDVLRSTLVSKLNLNKEDIVYNIGAGAGDVSVDIAKKVCAGLVYAFEKNEVNFKNMQKNKVKNGTFNIFNFFYEEDFLEDKDFKESLLHPNKVLISDNFENLKNIFNWIFNFDSFCKVVLNTNSLEKLNICLDFLKSVNLESEVIFLNSFNINGNEKSFYTQSPNFIISVNVN